MSEERFALKILLEVTDSDSKIIDHQSRMCNWLYNCLLEQANQLKQEFKNSGDSDTAKIVYSKRGLRNLLPKIKKENHFLKLVHSSPLKNTALRLSDAISTHQKSRKGKRKGSVVGWPKFRSWKQNWFSLFYDEPNKGFKIDKQMLILSLGMGHDKKRHSISVKLSHADLLKDKSICNLRIIYELGKYYAVFTIKKDLPIRKNISKVIAFDPNHKNLAYGVDTKGKAIEIQSPNWVKTVDKRIDEIKSKRDRCHKKAKKISALDSKGKEVFLPSNRWEKYNKVLEKALHKRREQIKTFMFTIANRLFEDYDCVAVGDYTPRGNGSNKKMRRAMNNQSLIGQWKKTLSWVALKSGKFFLEFNEGGTTRTCHKCLYVEPEGIPVDIREWQCKQCGTIHIRDENSAINGLEKILRNLSQNEGEHLSLVPGSGLVPVEERWAWCGMPSGILTYPRGQTGNSICSIKKLNRGHGSPRSKVG